MTATAHALVGGAIASTVHDPALGVSLAIISHPILDSIPHWDFGKGWRNKSKINFLLEGLFDLTLGLSLAYLIFGRNINPVYFLLVVFASLILDLLMVPYWFLRWKFPPFSWAYKFGSLSNVNTKLPWGLLNQAIAVVVVVMILRVAVH